MTTQTSHDHLEFTIPARYACRATLSRDGFGCERTTPVTMSIANTAVICMHVTDHGYPGGARYTGEPGVEAFYDLWHKRVEEIIDNHIVPLVNTARSAGMRIMYIGGIGIANDLQRRVDEVQASRPKIPPWPKVPENGRASALTAWWKEQGSEMWARTLSRNMMARPARAGI